MKAIVIKNLALPTGEDTFIDLRIQSNGKALLHCGMGRCSTYEVEEVEIPDEKK